MTSFAAWWDDWFDQLDPERKRAWYRKWEALGIPPAEVEPIRPEYEPRMSGVEVIAELDHFKSCGESARTTLAALGRGYGATLRLCRRYGRVDLHRWIAAEFEGDIWEDKKRRAA